MFRMIVIIRKSRVLRTIITTVTLMYTTFYDDLRPEIIVGAKIDFVLPIQISVVKFR
jgi:hypothetical protein